MGENVVSFGCLLFLENLFLNTMSKIMKYQVTTFVAGAVVGGIFCAIGTYLIGRVKQNPRENAKIEDKPQKRRTHDRGTYAGGEYVDGTVQVSLVKGYHSVTFFCSVPRMSLECDLACCGYLNAMRPFRPSPLKASCNEK